MDFRQYFYFIGVTLLVPLWILLFTRKESRKDMLLIGILFGLAATFFEHMYAKLDYWQPIFIFKQFPFEDFYYGFIYGGISAELSERLFKKRNSKRKTYPTQKKLLLIFSILAGFSFWLCVDVININSIVAHIIPPLIVGLVVYFIRKDIGYSQIFNAIALTVLTFFMFQILLIIYPEIFQNHWMLENLSGLYFIKIPIEELLFAFAVGFGAGNVYELIFGYSILDNKK